MWIMSMMTTGLLERERKSEDPFSMRPTVDATQLKRPAQVTTIMTMAVARMDCAKISNSILTLLIVL